MSELQADPADGPRSFCPQCLTVLDESQDPACPSCSLPLEWLDRESRKWLRRALSARQVRLHLSIVWPGGDQNRVEILPADLELSIGGERIRLLMRACDAPLIVESDTRQVSVKTPGSLDLGFAKIKARLVAGSDSEGAAPPVDDSDPEIEIALNDQLVELGRLPGNGRTRIHLPDAAVELQHAVALQQLVAENDTPEFWLVDLGGSSGTFVNREPIVSRRLASGDLVQIGSHSWSFSGEHRRLVPVSGIPGMALELRSITVKERTKWRRGKGGDGSGSGRVRLDDVNLRIDRGSFVAIIGPSGAGKSTLIRAILREPGYTGPGAIIADGASVDLDRNGFRIRIGYFSQAPTVHWDLTAKEAVEYAARLRLGTVREAFVTDVLKRVELPADRVDAPPDQLSGGQAARVRLATELIHEPDLLLLDEPTSGLDPATEAGILRLLRNLAYRGCTVIAVTHGLRELDLFDRVLVIGRGGRIRFDGTPAQLRERIPTGHFEGLECLRITDPPVAIASPAEHGSLPVEIRTQAVVERPTGFSQFRSLWAREFARLNNDFGRRVLLPVLLVPALFAVALSFGVPRDDLPLLGFLSILSTIWMGATLGLMAIVGEREVFDHEGLLFLRTGGRGSNAHGRTFGEMPASEGMASRVGPPCRRKRELVCRGESTWRVGARREVSMRKGRGAGIHQLAITELYPSKLHEPFAGRSIEIIRPVGRPCTWSEKAQTDPKLFRRRRTEGVRS